MEAITRAQLRDCNEGTILVMQLLRASCDHARALVYLFSTNPMDSAASALVLHRSQIEQFVRAVFFVRDASDEEIAYFLEHDEIPKRPTANGKQSKLHLNDLADIAHNRLGFDEDGKLASMIRNAWDPLNGIVHGGRAVRAFFGTAMTSLVAGCPRPSSFKQSTTPWCSPIRLWWSPLKRSDQSVEEVHQILTRPFEAITAYHRKFPSWAYDPRYADRPHDREAIVDFGVPDELRWIDRATAHIERQTRYTRSACVRSTAGPAGSRKRPAGSA